jgi:hypothetical protein
VVAVAVDVVADAVASATVAAVVVDVAVVALTVVAVAVAVAAPSTVVASATSPARRSLSTKRVDLSVLFGKKACTTMLKSWAFVFTIKKAFWGRGIDRIFTTTTTTTTMMKGSQVWLAYVCCVS